jgi:uncharacterized protein YecT (DUF1311 family)
MVPLTQRGVPSVSLRLVLLPVLASLAAPVLADPSLECSLTASSQVETGNCIAETEERVTAALAQVLTLAQSVAAELDAETGREMAVPALAASQAAWEAHRDAHCEYIGSTWGGGSGTGIAIGSCRIDMARDRMDALMASLN